MEWLPAVTPATSQPHALDVACGLGRHTLYLARHGWQVDAVDISELALDRLARAAGTEGLPVTCTQLDLEPETGPLVDPFSADRYDLAVMIRYTNLPLIAQLARALRPGGHLIAEAYLKTDVPDGGPRNPDYRVSPGDFRAAAAGLELVAYREVIAHDRAGQPASLAQMLARKPADTA